MKISDDICSDQRLIQQQKWYAWVGRMCVKRDQINYGWPMCWHNIENSPKWHQGIVISIVMRASTAPFLQSLTILVRSTHRQSPARLLVHMGYKSRTTSLQHSDCHIHACTRVYRYDQQQLRLPAGIGSTRAKVLRSYIITASKPNM